MVKGHLTGCGLQVFNGSIFCFFKLYLILFHSFLVCIDCHLTSTANAFLRITPGKDHHVSKFVDDTIKLTHMLYYKQDKK